MRRTYKSKKDTANVIERRDLFQNLDGKSTAYDAFSMQNIKQTKRELSCVGSSNPIGVASRRVRKKKYVKRIVKEPETPCQESMSQSAYLTPDKSIRVNKPLDPFDLLLMASPSCSRTPVVKKTETLTSQVNLFDHLVPKKEGKTYARRKPKRPKKFNSSSSDSSDSDKENSDERLNITQNTSDIGFHKLLVEEEPTPTPNKVNDSINNIVNNISLLNKLKQNKHKYNSNDSINKSLRINRHRLTKTLQSPMLPTSPLCSTPFKVKYRGDSIFKFSPIAVTSKESLKYNTIKEDNDDSNSSIILCSKVKKDSPKDNSNMSAVNIAPLDSIEYEMSVANLNPVKDINLEDEVKAGYTSAVNIISSNSVEYDTSVGNLNPEKDINVDDEVINGKTSAVNVVSNNSVEYDTSVVNLHFENERQEAEIVEERSQETKTSSNLFSDNSIPCVDLSSYQTTEHEEFMGFSKNAIDEVVAECKKLINISLLNETTSENDVTQISTRENHYVHEYNDPELDKSNTETEANDNGQCYESDDEKDVDNDINEKMDSENVSSQYESDDKESFYDTCTSDQSSIQEQEEKVKKPVVLLEKMNDSSFFRYYDQIKSDITGTDGNESSASEFASIEYSDKAKQSSEGSDLESDDENNDLAKDENEESGSNNRESSSNNEEEKYISESGDENNDSAKDEDEESGSNNGESSSNNEEEKCISESDDENNDSAKDEDEETGSNNGESSSNNEEEKCISFVTTRRRNELTNNSMISIFNDSYCSSSTDCDKTVLSNKDTQKPDIKRVSYIDNNDTLIDIDEVNNEDASEVIDLNKDSEHSDDTTAEHEPRISFVTTRNSNINRKSSLKPRNSSIKCRDSAVSKQNSILPRESINVDTDSSRMSCFDSKPTIVLQPGKKWERSLSIYRRMTMMTDHYDHSMIEAEETKNKGRKYRQSVISTMEMQDLNNSLQNESINSRRSTFISKPSRSTIRILKDSDTSRVSLCNTTVYDDLTGFLNEECDDTIIELSKLSIADQTHEVTVLDNFHDTSNRIATAKDYVLRRCNQTDAILFDECYPDVVLKNCHKIGEGVYGEVFLWRDRDGRARVLKIVPIAGSLKVNGENQKDFHEVISEIVIAMELSALRAPIAEIERHLDEGKDVEALDLHAIENATDVFNEVLAVRCVYGSYPSRLLDLWDLYDECKGSENDNPAILPVDQQYMVLELANAGQDLESYQFNNAEQAYALFLQVAYGLAVAEEAFQFEHRDLHWGNVLIAPTEQKFATFVLRGRPYRVLRRGVAASLIDYSLSRVCLRVAGEPAALYNDLGGDDSLFDAVGDYQFQVYRLMRDKLGNDWKNYAPYTNILWLHYTVDKMISALRYKRTNTKIHKHYIDKLSAIKDRILDYGSAALFVLTDNEI